MFQPIKKAIAVVFLAVFALGANVVMAAGPTVITEKEKPEPPVDASIGAITDLTRKVKVGQLKKDLRDANATAAPIPIQGPGQGPGQGSPTRIPTIGFGSMVGNAGAIPKAPPPQPSIQSITHVGDVTTAVSTDGRVLAVGTEMLMGDAQWKVTNVAPYGVTFEKCVKAKCTTTTIGVGR